MTDTNPDPTPVNRRTPETTDSDRQTERLRAIRLQLEAISKDSNLEAPTRREVKSAMGAVDRALSCREMREASDE